METTRIRLGLEWFLNPDHVPFVLAQRRGWFAEAGIDLELVEPDAHLDAFAAIQSGALDLAITEPIHLFEDADRGREVRGFARFLHTHGGVMALERSGIERPRDMAGKRVQYPGAPGPGGLAIVTSMIEADGGAPGALEPVNRGFRHTDALADDEADVATLVFHNFELVEAAQRGLPARLFDLEAWGVPNFCQLVLFGSAELVSARTALLRRLVGVLRRALVSARERPDEARRVYLEASGGDESDALLAAIYRATAPCFTFDLTLSAEYLESLSGWMHQRGLIRAPISPARVWTNALAVA